MLKLDVHTGMPMYFLKERKRGELKTRITFSHTLKSNVSDKVVIGDFVYRIDEITQLRESKLDYGMPDPVFFHDCKTTLVAKYVIGDDRIKVEVAVVEPIDRPL